MYAELSKELLSEKISLAEKISGKHLSLPALQGVYFQGRKEELLLRATNLDVGLEITLPASVEEEGELLVPASVFAQLVRSLPRGGTLTLSAQKNHLVLRSGKVTTRIKCLPLDDFPRLPQVEEGKEAVMEVSDFVSGVRAVWFAAATSSIKPELSSVYLFEDKGNVVFVATDSFRLAEKRVRPKKQLSFSPLLIPVKNIGEVVRVLETAEEGEVRVRYNQNQISFFLDGLYLTSRLIDGTFPDYTQIIPKNDVTRITVLKEDLQGALKKSSIFSNTFSQVTFKIEPHKNKTTIIAQNAEVGESEEVLEGEVEGEPLEISFNQKYVIDCFSSITSDSVTLFFSGKAQPVVIKGVADPSFFYLVMPMNQ